METLLQPVKTETQLVEVLVSSQEFAFLEALPLLSGLTEQILPLLRSFAFGIARAQTAKERAAPEQ